MLAKLLAFVKAHHADITLGVIVACMCLISFNMGKMSVAKTSPRSALAIISPPASGATADSGLSGGTAQHSDPRVVASKAAGSKLYHFTWCSGAKRISEKNKITFPNEAAAKAAGYTLAGNCNP